MEFQSLRHPRQPRHLFRFGIPLSGRPWVHPAALLAVALFAACASAPPEEEIPSAEGYYERGLKILEGRRVFFFFHDVDTAKAIEYFQEVIDNYPYSEYATLAELKIAGTHFDAERYDDAASYYQDFVELHPNHEQVPYAIYRNGLCSFEQIREADRDQGPARAAIEQFTTLIERYPDAEASREAREKLAMAQNRLAQQGLGIADFYFERRDYHAAIRRYREALARFPEHSDRTRTMARLANALERVHRYEEAERLYQEVLTRDEAPEDLVDEVRAQLAELPRHQAQRATKQE